MDDMINVDIIAMPRKLTILFSSSSSIHYNGYPNRKS